ncbi:MAG: RHS repeat domain-containing protein [bacterium]
MGALKLTYYEQETAISENWKIFVRGIEKNASSQNFCKDYFTFGMLQPKRNFNASSYRFGFSGHEKDDEIKGSGNSYDMGARMYHPRIGRTPSPDPKAAAYPNLSPYSYSAGNPIYFIDRFGEDVEVYVTAKKVGTTKINLYSSSEIKKDASLKNKTKIVPVYEVTVKNESGSSATFYFTREAHRGKSDGTTKEVTFNVRNDKDEFLGKIKSRWGGTDNVLELRDKDDINDQSVEAMKADADAIRTAIQFHVKGASDGCLLCVGADQFESTEEGAAIDKTNLKSNSSGSQSNFMSNIKVFQKEDKKAGKGTDINVLFEKVTDDDSGSSTTKEEEKK